MQLANNAFNALRVLMWTTAAVLLSIPALAMRFYPEAGFDWSAGDFAVVAVMLAVACGLAELGIRMARNNLAYFLGTIFAVGAGFLTVWVNMAVGMILSENNPENLVFLGVVLIALVGAFAVKFDARRLATVMMAAGICQALIGIVVAVAGLDEPYVAMLIAGFAVPWLLSAACFRTAARQMSPLSA